LTFLLDTTAASEPGRKTPDAGFVEWWAGVDLAVAYLSVLTIGELRKGLMRLPSGPQRQRLERLHALFRLKFAGQVLPIDERTAEVGGELSARLKQTTAIAHDLTVITRNVRHFQPTGCRVVCPWSESRV
jgi:predicted nucleic acid-binding protein